MKEDEVIYTIRLTREQALLALKVLDIEIHELQERIQDFTSLRATIEERLETNVEE